MEVFRRRAGLQLRVAPSRVNFLKSAAIILLSFTIVKLMGDSNNLKNIENQLFFARNHTEDKPCIKNSINAYGGSAGKEFGEHAGINHSNFWALNVTGAKNKLPPPELWLIHDSDNESTDIQGEKIPRNLHKIFIQKEGGFPVNHTSEDTGLTRAQKSWEEMNPQYTVEYFDLQSCRYYLQKYFHPIFLRVFDCMEAFAFKADLFRVAVVYREGGWYSDWKEECLKNELLDDLTQLRVNDGGDFIDFYGSWDKGNDFVIKNRCIQNAWFGSTRKHPLLEEYLRVILNNVHDEFYGEVSIQPTGPCAFGLAYSNVMLKDKELLHRTLIGGEHVNNIFNCPYKNEMQTCIQQKCDECGGGQDWAHGNNYNYLYGQRRSYCADAKSVFDL